MNHWKTMALGVFSSAAIGLVFPNTAMANSTVTVQPGQSLWSIARRHGMSVAALESANPGVNPMNLTIGSQLNLPEAKSVTVDKGLYTIRPGDTYWKIAQRFGTTASALMAQNPTFPAWNLQPGTTIHVPSPTSTTTHLRSFDQSRTAATTTSSDNLYWMAQIIHAEAGGQSYNAQIAVGDVVLHRMETPGYANTVKGVVFQISDGHYQFTPVANGYIYSPADTQNMQAAADVLNQHEDLVPGAMVFYNSAQTPATSWVRQQPTIKVIGDLTFAR